MPTPAIRQKLRKNLLAWYDRTARDLPWRRSRDPYHIWVSEIMLQQTQVKTVIPYYQNWIKAYPTMEKLAAAPEAQVLKHWEGLGYYSRARNLRKAAQQVVSEHGARVPETLDGILSLPGIGRYTAGAILSIAFGKKIPVLDGNVKRVLSRLFRMNENGTNRSSEEKLWQTAEKLLPARRVGDFNQAVMELGATICLPRQPDCSSCPLQSICEASRHGVQAQFPPAKPRTVIQKIQVSAAVIFKNGKVYIQQRQHGGLMGGLWEFPGGKLEPGETPEQCIIREIHEELGVQVVPDKKLMTIQHSYTQFRVTLHVFSCRMISPRLRVNGCEQWKWVKPSALNTYPFPAANVRIVESLMNDGNPTHRDK